MEVIGAHVSQSEPKGKGLKSGGNVLKTDERGIFQRWPKNPGGACTRLFLSCPTATLCPHRVPGAGSQAEAHPSSCMSVKSQKHSCRKTRQSFAHV